MPDIRIKFNNSINDIIKTNGEQVRWIESMDRDTKFCNRFLHVWFSIYPFYFEKTGTYRKVFGLYHPLRRPLKMKCPTRVYIWYLFSIYMIIKLTLFILLHLQLEHLLDYQKAQTQVRPPILGSCALNENIYWHDDRIEVEIRRVNSWITSIFGLTTVDNVGLIFNYCCCWFGLVFNTIMFLTVRFGNEYYMDSLSFVCNPIYERNRSKQELIEAINKICRELIRKPNSKYSTVHQCCSCISEPETQKIEISKIMLEKGFIDLIKPKNLDLGIYRMGTKIFKISLFSLVWTYVIILLIVLTVVITYEINHRAETDIEMIRCNQWHPNATIINNPMLLDGEPFISDLEYKSYINETNLIARQSIINRFELRRIFNGKFIISIIEVGLTGFILFLLTGFYTIIFVIAFMRRLAWAKDINRQLDSCLNLIDMSWSIFNLMKQNQPNCLVRPLLVTYLNLVMFRRDHKSYQRSLNTLTLALGVNCLIVWISAYLVYNFISKSDALVIWIVALAAYILFNSIITTCIILVSISQKLFLRVNRLVGKSSLMSRELSPVIDLWRHQLIDNEEITKIYSTSIFDHVLTRSNLLEINTYIIGALLYIMKIN